MKDFFILESCYIYDKLRLCIYFFKNHIGKMGNPTRYSIFDLFQLFPYLERP